MIALEQIAAILEDRGREECISNVKIDSSRGVVFSSLESRINSEKPYELVVKPDERRQELMIVVLSFAELPENSSLLTRLLQLHLALCRGSLSIEPSNGRLYYQMVHLVENRKGPTPDLLNRMLSLCVKHVRITEQVLSFGIMLEAGVPQEKAEQLVENLFGSNFITGWNRLMESRETDRVKEYLYGKNHDLTRRNH